LKILYYTSGITGWGRLVIGISIFNALKRNNIACEFTILSNSNLLFQIQGIDFITLPFEDEVSLSKSNYEKSTLYKTLIELKPDIILFDHVWYSIFHFIHELNCKKIFLCHQVDNRFFTIEMPDQKLVFNPNHFNKLITIEPFRSEIKMDSVNPVVFRNRDEIFPREQALSKLKLKDEKPVCLFSFNEKTGNFEKIFKNYSYLEDIYQMVHTHKFEDHLFPEIDYFNAFEFIVCSGGYNQFWEAIYFNKEAVFEPMPLIFEDQQKRINECQEYYFEENGADQLVDIIMNL
jgi:hypothetical protein